MSGHAPLRASPAAKMPNCEPDTSGVWGPLCRPEVWGTLDLFQSGAPGQTCIRLPTPAFWPRVKRAVVHGHSCRPAVRCCQSAAYSTVQYSTVQQRTVIFILDLCDLIYKRADMAEIGLHVRATARGCSRRLEGSAYDRGGARLQECAAA